MRRILSCILILGMLALPSRAVENKKYVALTFDDGPSGRYTQALLDTFDKMRYTRNENNVRRIYLGFDKELD